MLRTHRRLATFASLALVVIGITSCGSDATKDSAGAPDGTSSTTGSVYSTRTSAQTTTPSVGGAISPLAKTVNEHLSGFHSLKGIAVVVDSTGTLIITTAVPKADTAQGVVIDDAAMVAGQAAMIIDASDGTKIAGRSSGGQCA